MREVTNRGRNPIDVSGIVIRPESSARIPDDKWEAWIRNPAARTLTDAALTVSPPTGAVAREVRASEEIDEGDVGTMTTMPAPTPPLVFADMLGEDPEQALEEWWTTDLRPQVNEIQRRGLTLTAKERDAAWEAYLIQVGD